MEKAGYQDESLSFKARAKDLVGTMSRKSTS